MDTGRPESAKTYTDDGVITITYLNERNNKNVVLKNILGEYVAAGTINDRDLELGSEFNLGGFQI